MIDNIKYSSYMHVCNSSFKIQFRINLYSSYKPQLILYLMRSLYCKLSR